MPRDDDDGLAAAPRADGRPAPGADAAVVAAGLIAGTQIATAGGWRAVETLRPRDAVLTFDDGVVNVVSVDVRMPFAGSAPRSAAHWPLRVPPGALGNRSAVLLLPEQPVMAEPDAAAALLDDPFVLLPARALVGFRGIAPVLPVRDLAVVTLGFETAQVVYADTALRLLCPATDATLTLPDPMPTRYAPLPLLRALERVAVLVAGDVGAALGAAPSWRQAARARAPKRP